MISRVNPANNVSFKSLTVRIKTDKKGNQCSGIEVDNNIVKPIDNLIKESDVSVVESGIIRNTIARLVEGNPFEEFKLWYNINKLLDKNCIKPGIVDITMDRYSLLKVGYWLFDMDLKDLAGVRQHFQDKKQNQKLDQE